MQKSGTWREFCPGRPAGICGRVWGGMAKGGALKGAGSCSWGGTKGAPKLAVNCAAPAGSGVAQLVARGACWACNPEGPGSSAPCS